MITTLHLAALASLAATSAALAAAPDDPLAHYRGQHRVLVVLAASSADELVARQHDLFAAMRAGAEERDLVLVDGSGDTAEAAALRRRFGFEDGFKVVLVGKDGGEKLAGSHPLGPDELFPLIDAMPMRRQEMRRQR